MKKLFTLILGLMLGISLISQQVPRDMVVVEGGTGFWCGYCPGAALGADQLVENGHNVAIMENHNGDSLANVYSNARNTYYNITGYPTYNFDGILSVVGGSATQSMYSTYVPKVNARNAIPSDFTIDLAFTNVGNNNYSATITMDNVGGNTTTGLKLHLSITESHLPISWGLGEYVNFVNRLMVPNQNGTSIDFSGGTTQIVNLNFTVAGFWDIDNCEIIAFIQAPNKEILQGTKKFMAVPLYNLDAQAKSVVHPEGAYCGTSIAPVVLIKNMGADNLTSLDIEYSINGGVTQFFAWTGNLGFNLGAEVTLPNMPFVSQPTNSFEFTVNNPNGQPDPNPDNNSLNHNFESAPQIPTSTVNFEIKTDQYPSETTWKVRNSSGAILYSGGPYTGANTIYTAVWQFSAYDCYTFTIYDQYGDGICCSYGQGYYKLKDENNVVLIQGGQFGTEETKPFERHDANAVSADFIANVTSIIEGDQVNFSDMSSGSITTWDWTFEGGTPATSTEQNPMVTYLIEGVYDVTLTVSNGINTNTTVKQDYIMVDHLTGIGNVNQTSVNIFPNPTNGLVYITGTGASKINVYNATGNRVASYSDFNGNSLDLSELENGIYFISIVKDNETTIAKKITILK
jgi:PKD repeat protein